MEINLLEMWASMGFPVRAVVTVLTLQAIAVIAVTVDRLIMLQMSRSRSTKFAVAASKVLGGGLEGDGLLTLAKSFKGSHLASLVAKGLATYADVSKKGFGRERSVELTRRAMERKVEPLSRDLNRGMNVLASTGSTAPFVGLLGTVLGIIQAFKTIAATGSGGIGTIGASIGEALIVTGYGLVVAIPTVLLFNAISGRLAAYEGDILNAAGDLVDSLETGGVTEPVVSVSRETAAETSKAADGRLLRA